VNDSTPRYASSNVLWIALAIGALTACQGTTRDGEGGDGAGGVMSSTAGSGGSGASGGAAGSSGVNGGAAGSGGSGSGGMSGAGASGGGNGGQGGATDMDASADAMIDAGGQDSGPLTASCAGDGYLLCEDFEDTALDAVPDGWSEYGDLIGVDDDQAASGTKSLKLGETNDGRLMFRDASSLPSTHWGRIRYRVQTPVPDAFVHSTLVSFTGQSPADNADLEMRVVDTVKQSSTQPDVANRHQFLYNVQRVGQNEFGQEGPYDWMFEAQWHCVEWYVSSADQAFRFFFDGDEVEQMAFENGAGNYDNSEIPSTFDQLKIGWVNYQEAEPGFVAWIDDVAIAEQRVTCAE
jgi:hypothetical protein